jgi:hypothetical protein
MDLQELNNELDAYLKKYPHLLDLQAKISYDLAMLDSMEARCYYLQEEMLDKLEELKCELEKATTQLNSLTSIGTLSQDIMVTATLKQR